MRSPCSIPSLLLIIVLGCCQSFTLLFEQKRNFASSAKARNAVSSPSTDSLETVKSLTKIAIYECGTKAGLDALRELSELCRHRRAFDFNERDNKNNENERLVSHLPGLFPEQDRTKFLKMVRHMESNEWLSQNPDSVDKLPSLHLNLISQAKPIFPIDDATATKEGEDDDSSDFESGIQQLYRIVQPYIYDVLLRRVKEEMSMGSAECSSSSINLRVSDVFLRRYGQDICGGDRNGISAHYDVFSKVTAVIALDDVASDGRNGLFITVVDEETGQTSNHKACRRFFPLRAGDAVVHTWDILHGVDVEPGLDRTSLIVWFDEFPENESDVDETEGSTDTGISPWLTSHPDMNENTTNDVLQFVLASAISSANEPEQDKALPSSVERFLHSASKRNTFALTRMGSLCEDGSLDDSDLQEEATRVLDSLRPRESLPSKLLEIFTHNTQQELAIRFWLEGAIGGSPLAQKALADELMVQASHSGNADGRLLAAVLFALAAQQDDDGASESLSRVIEYDAASRGVDSEEAFLASPVVQLANAAIAA